MPDFSSKYKKEKTDKLEMSRGSSYNDKFSVDYTPNPGGTFTIRIFGEIHSPNQFEDALEVLDSASEDDTVVIRLSTDGGDTDATDTFVSAMQRCKARVLVEASGGVHSAGTIILMNAPEFRLSDNFNALIHNGSIGAAGKTSDTLSQLKFYGKYMEKLFTDTYKGFLTDEELSQLMSGADFWLTGNEWVERWKNRQKYLDSVQEEMTLIDDRD